MKKAVGIIAVLATVGFIINIIIMIIGLVNKSITWWLVLISLFSNIVALILLWALHNALDRIETLENSVWRNKHEIEILKKKK